MFEMFATIVSRMRCRYLWSFTICFYDRRTSLTFTAAAFTVLSLSYSYLPYLSLHQVSEESKSCMSILMIIFIMISTPLHFIGQVTLSVTLYRIFSLITLT